MNDAERDFRAAFERLKNGHPLILPAGAVVNQRNVAKEAGRDPSALRKARYPALINEIQQWGRPLTEPIRSMSRGGERSEIDRLRARVDALTSERDAALSRLLEADATIIELLQHIESGTVVGALPSRPLGLAHGSER